MFNAMYFKIYSIVRKTILSQKLLGFAIQIFFLLPLDASILSKNDVKLTFKVAIKQF